MELKYIILIQEYFALLGFNRTFMELKLCKKRSDRAGAHRFNRTFMELK